jgi:hypothetical protein
VGKELVCFSSGNINDSVRTIDPYEAPIRRPFIAKATVLYLGCVFKYCFTLPGIDLRYFIDPSRNLGIVLNNYVINVMPYKLSRLLLEDFVRFYFASKFETKFPHKWNGADK